MACFFGHKLSPTGRCEKCGGMKISSILTPEEINIIIDSAKKTMEYYEGFIKVENTNNVFDIMAKQCKQIMEFFQNNKEVYDLTTWEKIPKLLIEYLGKIDEKTDMIKSIADKISLHISAK